MSASSLVDLVENPEKEKKRKEKKKKEKSAKDDGGEIGALPPTEPQPVSSTSMTEDNVITVRLNCTYHLTCLLNRNC